MSLIHKNPNNILNQMLYNMRDGNITTPAIVLNKILILSNLCCDAIGNNVKCLLSFILRQIHLIELILLIDI